jgi:hypothetical protein
VQSDSRVLGLLADTKWQIDPASYVMVGMAPTRFEEAASLLDGKAFFALLVDDLELTVFMEASAWARSGITDCSVTEVRLLTFPAVLPPDLVGFLSIVASALAEAGVPILPLAANRRDHVFVPALDLETAEAALAGLSALTENRQV